MRVRQPPSKSKSQKWRLKLGRLLSPHHKETDDADIVSSSAEWDTKSVGKEEHGSFDDPESTSAAIERFGLFTVNTEIAETTVDIVAVHGLGGHYQTTWTWFPTNPNTSSPCNWLEDLLPHEFPNARIMSFGYNSAVVHSKSVGDISTFAEQLLQFLSRERFSREQKIRPIIFICHSLGGIVVKKMLNLANERRRLREFNDALIQSLKGIIFMGTPHRGSNTADLGSIGARVLEVASLGRSTNTEIIKQLRQGTKVLQEISTSFVAVASDLQIWTFVESDRMGGLSEPIVTADSARLNMPNEEFCPLNGNHRTMCKFNGRNENYKTVVHAINGLVGAYTINFSKYLADIELIAAPLPQISEKDAEEIAGFDFEDLVWFFESPEFAHWKSHGSQALLLSGKPGSGKTTLSRYLWNHLERDRTYTSCQDIAMYFPSTPTNLNQVTKSPIAHVLFTLIVQLLKADRERLETVAPKFPLHDLSSPPISSSLHPLKHLWKFLFASIVAVPNRKSIIIIDALDEVPNNSTPEMRQNFLRNLLQLRADVSNTGVDLKIFLTSRPYDDIKKELSSIPSIERDKERQECLRSLHFDESSAQRDRVERAHPDSGKWLTSEDDYKKWKSSAHSSLFLIRGKPGSGKSTLAKHILEGISSHSSTESYVGSTAKQIKHDSLVASFFYSFRGGKEKTSHTMMLQSLLYQLLSQEERLFPLFQKIYRAKRSASKIEWQKEDLEKVFAALPSLKTQQTIYIFLDAMDESAEEGRPEILKILQNICATDSNCTFKCLIASRPLPDGQIDESAHYGIILQDKNRGDIEKLITSGLQHITKLAGGGAVDFELAYEHMVNNAHGVFLWVSLVLKELEKVAASGASQEEVDFCLRNLPLDLEEMYERIIQRLKHQPQSMIDQAVKMLTWVTFAGRPLSIEELHDAVVIPTHPKPFNPHSRFLERAKIHGFEKRLQVCCGPLLEVRQSAVQLLHQTIREHLLREDRRATPFDTDEGRGDTEIAFGCIRYLSLLCLPSFTEPAVTWSSRAYDEFVKWLTGYPLLLYVVYFLSRHLKSLAGDSTVLNELLGLFKDFQKQDASFCLFEGWMRTLGRSETSFPPSMNPGQFRAKCLIAAVKNGHEGVSRSVLALQTDINAIDEDSGNSALHMAVDTKSKSMVELLLSMNANINLKNRKSQTPFSRAAELGLEGIALLLLETNTYGNRAIAQLGNAMAASLGHEALAKLLLDSGADVNARDGEHGNALEAAVSGGHPGIVELLLDSDADFNAQGRKYETALLAVRQRGHQRISQMLLDATADPNL